MTASSAPRGRRKAPRVAEPIAEHLPVARVVLDLPLLHLDHPFDYAVPASLAEIAQPGVRVKVRFAGRRIGGFIVERRAEAEHAGRLAPLDTVVSAEPVLDLQVLALARAVADHYVGTVADVLRLAVPPRHARVEAEPNPPAPDVVLRADPGSESISASGWGRLDGGQAFLGALAAGERRRAVALVPPAADPFALCAEACAATVRSGRGALLVVPDGRDAARAVAACLRAGVAADAVAVLTADVGPAERYRRFLAVRRGRARVVIGTRAAVFAPVQELGLVALWDDGDDLHDEPRAPYPHAREVLALRAGGPSGVAFLLAGHVRTVEAERLIRSGWATALESSRDDARTHGPLVRTPDDDVLSGRDPAAGRSRIPGLVLRTIREALTVGPVLVQVPRAGYVPALRCGTCRSPARCSTCSGPLRLEAEHADPVCGWCGTRSAFACTTCSGTMLRAARTGSGRTADELGRALPGIRIVTSGRGGIVESVPDAPSVVVATPGAEPFVAEGYAGVMLLDGDLLLDRADLRADEEALRRWANAVSLLGPRAPGASVVVVADPAAPATQALVRRDPVGFAQDRFAEREATHLPPAARLVSLTGTSVAVEEFVAGLALPAGAERLGPVLVDSDSEAEAEAMRVRMVVRVPLSAGRALARSLREVGAARSARKAEHVTVRVDPLRIEA